MCFIACWVSIIVYLAFYHKIYLCFIYMLEGFFTSFQNYHKTSFVILQFGSVFHTMLKWSSNYIFENPYHQRAVGWATMPCMLKLKIILTCAWKGSNYELYTWSSLCFQLISQLIFILYTHICFYICMLKTSNSINSIGI